MGNIVREKVEDNVGDKSQMHVVTRSHRAVGDKVVGKSGKRSGRKSQILISTYKPQDGGEESDSSLRINAVGVSGCFLFGAVVYAIEL